MRRLAVVLLLLAFAVGVLAGVFVAEVAAIVLAQRKMQRRRDKAARA